MVKELATKPLNKALATNGQNHSISLSNSTEEGGVSIRDFETPRAVVLYEDKEGVKAGTLVNSITSEILSNTFVPLFPFKNYVKFSKDLKVEWATVNRNDPRVIDGLDQKHWNNGGKPPVTEFLNFVVVFGNYEEESPMILSFKSSGFKLGKKYNSMFSLSSGLGVPQNSCQQYLQKHRYEISPSQVKNGSFVYWQTIVSIPKDKSKWSIDADGQQFLRNLANNFSRLVSNISADTYSEEAGSGEVDLG